MNTMICGVCGKEISCDKAPYHEPLCSYDCFIKDFWNDIVDNKNRRIIVDGKVFLVGSEDKSRGGFRGFGGRQFIIRMLDTKENETHLYKPNEVFISTNLWFNGDVPDDYKDQLPNNAEFISEKEYKELVSNEVS